MGRVLYNRFVDIHHKVKPRSHGNYLPSLDQAEKLLQTDSNHPATALCLLFLSDGKPSDNSTGILRCNPQEALVAMCVTYCAEVWGHRPVSFASQA